MHEASVKLAAIDLDALHNACSASGSLITVFTALSLFLAFNPHSKTRHRCSAADRGIHADPAATDAPEHGSMAPHPQR